MEKNNKIIISITLVAIGLVCRLLPHLWNFAPIAAIALFSGFYLGRRYAIILPLISMAIGDLFIGFYDFKMMLAVYISFALVGLFGFAVRKYKSLETVVASSIIASVAFYLITNYVVWQFSPWYARSFDGLIYCYTMALPFFRNTLMGDLFYVAVFFGAYEMVKILAARRKMVGQIAKID